MPRKRMIDPSIWTDEKFGELSVLGRLMFIGMFSMADDEGRGEASPKVIKGKIFTYDEGLRLADVIKTLAEIGSKMSVEFYSHQNRDYYAFINWKDWQKVEKPTPSRLPPPSSGGKGEISDFLNYSPNTPRTLPEHSPNTPLPIEQKGIEVNRKKRDGVHTCTTPTLEEVKETIVNEKLTVSAERFFYYYEGSGWMHRGVPIKNWRAVLKSWQPNEEKFAATSKPVSGEYIKHQWSDEQLKSVITSFDEEE